MFTQNSQTPIDDTHKTFQTNPRHRRKKSFKQKRKGNKRKTNNRKDSAFAQPIVTTTNMSSWAENFTHAVTWQMKQQIAYWKSKATALEYENKLLHEIIRKNYMGGPLPAVKSDSDSEDIQETIQECANSEDEEGNSEEEFEVSEEYIQFLMQNAKYKEDARRERERFKATQNSEENLGTEMKELPITNEEKEKILKSLYGENWQRIGSIEISMLSQFIDKCQADDAVYWPNIPLKFNFT